MTTKSKKCANCLNWILLQQTGTEGICKEDNPHYGIVRSEDDSCPLHEPYGEKATLKEENISCKTCRYRDGSYCKSNPPAVFYGSSIMSHFPPASDSGWCGEWAPRYKEWIRD